MRPEQIVQRVLKGIHVITQANHYVAIVVFCLMGILTTFDVVGRYVLNSPIAGSYEIVEIMMLVLVYSIFAYVAEADANVRVDIFFAKLSNRTKATLDIFFSLASIGIMSLITWRMIYRVIDVLIVDPRRDYYAQLSIPLWPFVIIAAWGSIVLILELLLWFFRSVRNATMKG